MKDIRTLFLILTLGLIVLISGCVSVDKQQYSAQCQGSLHLCSSFGTQNECNGQYGCIWDSNGQSDQVVRVVKQNYFGSGDSRLPYLSVAAPNANTIFMSYFTGYAGDLKFAKSTNGGTTWSTSTIDGDGPFGNTIGEFNSIDAVDANNLLVSYYDWTNTQLKLATSSDGGQNWNKYTIHGGGGGVVPGKGTSMDALSANTYAVSYYYYDVPNSDSSLKVRTVKNGVVNIRTVEQSNSDLNMGRRNSVSLIDENNIFVSYLYAARLRFAKSNNFGESWTTKDLGYVGTWEEYTSIDAVDANTIFVSYYNNNNGDLEIAWTTNGGSNWNFKTVDSSGTCGKFNSIDAVDSNTIFVSYNCEGNVKLAESRDGGTTWTNKIVRDIGQSDSPTSVLALDATKIFVGYDKGFGAQRDLFLADVLSKPVGCYDSFRPDDCTGFNDQSQCNAQVDCAWGGAGGGYCNPNGIIEIGEECDPGIGTYKKLPGYTRYGVVFDDGNDGEGCERSDPINLNLDSVPQNERFFKISCSERGDVVGVTRLMDSDLDVIATCTPPSDDDISYNEKILNQPLSTGTYYLSACFNDGTEIPANYITADLWGRYSGGAVLPYSDCSGNIDLCDGGKLGCTNDCRLDTSLCTGCDVVGFCGDGTINNNDERCDGSNLDGKSCADFGLSGNSLRCYPSGDANECTFDTSGCVEKTRQDKSCGDDLDGCDKGQTCCPDGAEGGYKCTPGSQCAEVYCVYNNDCDPAESCLCSDCWGEQDRCISGSICERKESGNNVWGECAEGIPSGECGNGDLEAGEECDDGNLIDGDGCDSSCKIEDAIDRSCGDSYPNGCPKGNTCCDDGSGTVSCYLGSECAILSCGVSLTDCEDGDSCGCDECEGQTDNCAVGLFCMNRICDERPSGVCGDNNIDRGEECDGTDLPVGVTCLDIDQCTGGSPLSCYPSGAVDAQGNLIECTLDTSGCTGCSNIGACGDGTVNGEGERCDCGTPWSCSADDFSPITCESFGLYGDGLSCYNPGHDLECAYNTENCLSSPPAGELGCGDGILQFWAPYGEECEDGNEINDGNGCGADCKIIGDPVDVRSCGNGVIEDVKEEFPAGDALDRDEYNEQCDIGLWESACTSLAQVGEVPIGCGGLGDSPGGTDLSDSDDCRCVFVSSDDEDDGDGYGSTRIIYGDCECPDDSPDNCADGIGKKDKKIEIQNAIGSWVTQGTSKVDCWLDSGQPIPLFGSEAIIIAIISVTGYFVYVEIRKKRFK